MLICEQDFVTAVEAAGMTFLGPTASQMVSMGLKHEAREVAIRAGVPVIPGSAGLIHDLTVALDVAQDLGYPVMLKATAGGGGMGMSICEGMSDMFELLVILVDALR